MGVADLLDLSELEVWAKVGELDRANLKEEGRGQAIKQIQDLLLDGIQHPELARVGNGECFGLGLLGLARLARCRQREGPATVSSALARKLFCRAFWSRSGGMRGCPLKLHSLCTPVRLLEWRVRKRSSGR